MNRLDYQRKHEGGNNRLGLKEPGLAWVGRGGGWMDGNGDGEIDRGKS